MCVRSTRRKNSGKVSQEIYGLFKAEKLIAFNMPLMQLCVYACILTVSWLERPSGSGRQHVGAAHHMFSYIMMILKA